MTHWITHTLEVGGHRSCVASCDEPEGAACRLVCEHERCAEEGWSGPLLRDEKGPYHLFTPHPDEHRSRHDLRDNGHCNWTTWMNEGGEAEWLSSGGSSIVGIAAVEPVWHPGGEVGYEPYVDDGHVEVSWSSNGVVVQCTRPECTEGGYWWSHLLEGRLAPPEITRAWYAHLATHYEERA